MRFADSRDVLPALPAADPRDLPGVQADFGCDLSVGHPVGVHLADPDDFGFIRLRERAALPDQQVSYVVGLGSEIEMPSPDCRIAADRVVALMENLKSGGNGSVHNLPSSSVGHQKSPAPNPFCVAPELSISEAVSGFGCPGPADGGSSGTVHVCPETLFERQSVPLDLLDYEWISVFPIAVVVGMAEPHPAVDAGIGASRSVCELHLAERELSHMALLLQFGMGALGRRSLLSTHPSMSTGGI